MTAIKITNFVTDAEVQFFREYKDYAIKNPSKQVSLITGGERTYVDRDYYSILSPFKLFDRIRKIAEKNWKKPFTFREDSYAQLMHYKTGSKGLQWHVDKNLCHVGASINLSPEYEHDGGDFEMKGHNTTNPYKSIILYDETVMHRVTPVSGGEKLSLVIWLPYKGQEVSKGQTWKYE